MAKQGLVKNHVPNLVDKDRTWALCVGSGISFPLFPMWEDLSKEFIKKHVPVVSNSYSELSKRMSSSVLLQAAAEMAGMNHEVFSKELTTVLYEGLYAGLSKDELSLVRKCLYCYPDADIDWNYYLEIIHKKAPSLTAMTIAEKVLQLKEKGRAPSSILSFNAEMLLGSLINALGHEVYGYRKKIFDYIKEPTSYHMRDRIPYYFCHGVLPIPGAGRYAKRMFDAADRLVFLENEYLQLANSSFTWQSSAFMNTLTSHIVFLLACHLWIPISEDG